VLVLAGFVVTPGLGTFAAGRGAAVIARHRAESAADLAALAGAGRIGIGGDPCAAAAAIAAGLTSCEVRLGPPTGAAAPSTCGFVLRRIAGARRRRGVGICACGAG
jgi:Putative Flp pilus-assembly TadE/G-like